MATNTYTALSTQILGTSSTSVNLTSIPQGYTDLVLVMNIKATSAGSTDININFNSDTTSLYSRTYLAGNGTSALSGRASGTTTIQINNWSAATSTNFNYNAVVNIMGYSNTTTFKTVLARTNNADNAAEASVDLYRSTNAISSIQITPGASRAFDTGSTFTLYGIASAAASAKATGGYITSDDTYWYHTFKSTGTFTPLQSLTADILVVAGGGGGGRCVGGGGGAGGLLSFTSQSLTTTGYTCTVGSGGAGGTSVNAAATNGGDSQFAALTLVKGGGGGAGGSSGNGVTGGSGGGGGGIGGGTGGSGTSGQGYAGYTGAYSAQVGGGGGGSSAAATNKNGANGVSTYSSWLLSTGVGQLVSSTYYIAGGGGAGTNSGAGGESLVAGTGGYGGGASGYNQTSLGVPTAALANTGGGGGGSGGNGDSSNGGNGGSGVIIVRYAK